MNSVNLFWTTGTIVLDDYQIEELLGQGGLGAVYRVRSLSTNRIHAVKRILPELSLNPERRKAFLAELLIWAGLPSHPNLTAFRFFRRFQSEILVFLEFADAGPLSDWIRYQRIPNLITAIDIAIQSARGLFASHRCGLIHQDVKPSNILMTSDGVAKITDFSLSKFQPASLPVPPPENLKVSCLGMTPAYCSPEQAQKLRLDRTTDVWSWGVTIMEMLNQTHHRHFGISAPFVLDQWRSTGPEFQGERVPEAIFEILDRCFQKDPADRWQSLIEPIGILEKTYAERAGFPYLRPDPIISAQTTRISEFTASNPVWTDPETIIARIHLSTGLDYSDSRVDPPDTSRTSRVAALADLITFDDILQDLDARVGTGDFVIDIECARLSREAGFIHQYLGDLPGRLQLMRRSIRIFERVYDQAGTPMFLREMIQTLNNLGVSYAQLSRYQEAIDTYRSALDRVGQIGTPHGDTDELACRILPNLANALRQTGRLEEACGILDEAGRRGEQMAGSDAPLAYILTSKAQILEKLGRYEEALDAFDRAIVLYRKMDIERDARVAALLSQALSDKAIVFDMLRNYEGALAMYGEAIRITETLVRTQLAADRAPHLARMHVNEGLAYLNLERYADAIHSLDRGVALLGQLVFEQGRTDLLDDYALAVINQSHPRIALGNLDDASTCLVAAENYCDRIAHSAPQIEVDMYRGMIRHLRARVARQRGEQSEAIRCARDAAKHLEKALARSTRSDIRLLLQEVVSEFQLEP